MDISREAALLETILFLESEPIDTAALASASGLAKDVVSQALAWLQQHYNGDDCHGLELVELAGGYILTPKKDYWESLRGKYGKRNENRLSRAALETLAIIAYSQPVTRMEIESIRGVSPDGMIRLLLEKSLIKEVGRKDVPGKPIQFGTTKDFLLAFRLKSIADLPKLDEIEAERFELDGR